ncbi:alcohol dehydrogenase catalytic domain-containing protein [Amycolatopsis pithecellobii]|uniref:Zinc-binding dehydrogenase n=1 Tax=Amycolatopsis pithecellobii TaxID=664692 RepID=A0A6N7ZAV8_9PSEU|nr:zinc-binding dehydrogenase [Amycolatopsis pithecellobii]MTD58894.1 zinc-binding dehydrogenase [Amycolatopsis pithecellobii]
MRAARITAFGGPEVLEIAEVPAPEAGAGEVLVRVRAGGLNRADILVREGRFPEAPPPPMILGVEGAGEIAALGDGVSGFAVGDRVAINPMRTCDECEQCRRGHDNACARLQFVGEHFDGTYAEYIVVPARSVIPAPAGLSHEQLAAGVLAYMTAWHMLKTRGQVRPGETVLVVGAGSGVASAAVQVAKALGATVIATTGTERKAEQVRALGADEVINYRAEPDFPETVRKLTGGLGADLVHETVGRATVQKSILSLRHGGRLVGMGSHTGRTAELDLSSLYRREISVFGCHASNLAEVAEFLPLLADGTLSPVIDSVFPLDAVVEAEARLDAPDRFGKVVLAID